MLGNVTNDPNKPSLAAEFLRAKAPDLASKAPPVTSGRFWRNLGLDKRVLNRLEQVSSYAADHLPRQTKSSSASSSHTTSYPSHIGVGSEQATLEIEHAALTALGKEFAAAAESSKAPTTLDYSSPISELEEFRKDINLLFGSDQGFSKELNGKLDQIKNLYEQKQALGSSNRINELEDQINKLQKDVANDIKKYCESPEVTEKLDAQRVEKVATGVKMVANMVTGFKLESLLKTAGQTHEMVGKLKEGVDELQKLGEKYQGTGKGNKALRKELYGNIKQIQERSMDLLSVSAEKKALDKAEKKLETALKIGKKIRLPKAIVEKLEAKVAKEKAAYDVLKGKCEELSKAAGKYFDKFNFDPDEIRKYENLSIETHRPSREHLMRFVNDITAGAELVGEQLRQNLRSDLMKEYIIASNPLGVMPEKDQKDLFTALDRKVALEKEISGVKSADPHNEPRLEVLQQELTAVDGQISQIKSKKYAGLNEVIEAYQTAQKGGWEAVKAGIGSGMNDKLKEKLALLETKEKAIDEYQGVVMRARVKAEWDPRIGKGGADAKLSMEKKELKKEIKAYKAGAQERINELKSAYVEMTRAVEEKTSTKPVSKAELKTAAKALTKGRDAVLLEKARADGPVTREIEVPPGPLSLMLGQAKTTIKTISDKVNRFYPSSAFRGREAGRDCVQPNSVRIECRDEDGEELISYTASSINVEFFQLDDQKRYEATQHQTAGILLEKVDNRIQKLGKAAGEVGKTKEDPLEIDVMHVSLLSPDAIRGFLGRIFPKKVDPSLQERKMLLESREGWLAFSKEFEGKDIKVGHVFKLQGKNGEEREMKHEGNGVFSCEIKDAEGGKRTLYIKFNINSYNVGTNKVATYMTTGPKRAIAGTRALENDMNARAFKKDTERYHAKLEKLSAEKTDLKAKISEETEKALIGGLDTQTSALHGLRDKFYEANKAYHENLNPAMSEKLLAARNEAFQAWKNQRNDVAIKMGVALKDKKLSPAAKAYLKVAQHEENLRDIYNEVKDQLEFKDYLTKEGMKESMFSLPSALVALGHELGADPHTNCRSGKDRTGLQKMEIALRGLIKKGHGRYLHFMEVAHNSFVTKGREEVYLNSGAREQSAPNIGSIGLNLGGTTEYLKRSAAEILGFGVSGAFMRSLK